MNAESLLAYDLPLFAGVSVDDLAGIPLDIAETQLDAWQTLFNQHETSHDIFFLISGALLAVFWTKDGREIVFSRFPEGAYFGELAALDGTARSLAVFAKTNATILTMRQESFLRLFNDVPVIRDRVVRQLVGRIRSLTERNMEMTTLSVEQRVGAYLLRLAAEHGKLASGAVIENAPTHAEIAATIGANREMVSRSISKLAKRGAIRPARQRIEIVDPEILSESLI